MDQRFEFTNERLIRKEETLSSHIELTRKGFAVMEEHFNAVDQRFETMTQRMDKFMQWSFATMIATGSFVVAVLKLWPPVLP